MKMFITKIISMFFAFTFIMFLTVPLLRSVQAYPRYTEADKALDFVESLLWNYDGDKWLCKEYKNANRCWLYNDNYLAYQIFQTLGRNDLAEKIRATFMSYGIPIKGNGRIEVLFNRIIPSPPYTGAACILVDYSTDMQLGSILVNNSDVELGDEWPLYWYHAPEGAYWTSEESHSSTHSLKIVGNCSRWIDWRSETFPVTGSRSYMVRCYLKGVANTCEPFESRWVIMIRWYNETSWIGQDELPIVAGNYEEWTLLQGIFASPKDAVKADLIFGAFNATGIMYADDLEVRELIKEGSFMVMSEVRHMQIRDWEEYADLLLFDVINKYYQGDPEYAQLWEKAYRMFDGKGMVDKSFNDTFLKTGHRKYETYKLALFILASKIIDRPIPENCSHILWSMQNRSNGGITTHYLPDLTPDPNATQNIETTCLAIYSCFSEDEVPIPENISIFMASAIIAMALLMIREKRGHVRLRIEKL